LHRLTPYLILGPVGSDKVGVPFKHPHSPVAEWISLGRGAVLALAVRAVGQWRPRVYVGRVQLVANGSYGRRAGEQR